MVQLTSRTTGLLALFLAVLASLAAPASAQGPAEIAARCVNAIQETGDATVAEMRSAARRGIRVIGFLDGNDASDDELREAASRARDAINADARAGSQRINRMAQLCVARLQDLDADRMLIARVINARDTELEAVNAAREAAIERVGMALRRALNN